MKKKIIIFVILILLVCALFGIIISSKKINVKTDIVLNINNISSSLENIVENKREKEYVDENEMQIGLYIDEGSTKRLVDKYYCDFSAENVMGIFYAIPTKEEVVNGEDFKSIFDTYYNRYENKEKYKIGYNIKFELKDGRVIDETILNPDDAFYMFPKVQCYLYDDINLIPGRPYYHITQDIMTEDRICSSIKLVGDKESKNIISPIELTVFTFDGEDDFTPITRKYRGNNKYTIYIYKK